ncbi:MAG: imidazole glycerol phosphate synthase subunit HisH [Chromatiales bacterium]
MKTVAVIDYGMSNLRSVAKAIEFVAQDGHRVQVTDDPDVIRRADRVVFPGQGAIGQCVAHLREHALIDVVQETLKSRPFLGICLGLQSLVDWSEEDGGTPCLAFMPGRVLRFADGMVEAPGSHRLKIPHMGWNEVHPVKPHALWRNIEPGARFYFVHSYYVAPARADDVAASTRYGVEFASAVARENVFATQFHPEKSQKAGLTLLGNFLSWGS